jgi:hypothetical protein
LQFKYDKQIETVNSRLVMTEISSNAISKINLFFIFIIFCIPQVMQYRRWTFVDFWRGCLLPIYWSHTEIFANAPYIKLDTNKLYKVCFFPFFLCKIYLMMTHCVNSDCHIIMLILTNNILKACRTYINVIRFL